MKEQSHIPEDPVFDILGTTYYIYLIFIVGTICSQKNFGKYFGPWNREVVSTVIKFEKKVLKYKFSLLICFSGMFLLWIYFSDINNENLYLKINISLLISLQSPKNKHIFKFGTGTKSPKIREKNSKNFFYQWL